MKRTGPGDRSLREYPGSGLGVREDGSAVKFHITLPPGITARFRYGDQKKVLQDTDNVILV